MGILHIAENKTFHLSSRDTSYILSLVKSSYLTTSYWGTRIRAWHDPSAFQFANRSFAPNPIPTDYGFSLDAIPLEYPGFGNSDFRSPAFQVRFADGSTVSDLAYKSWRVVDGKPPLAGLPATYVERTEEAQTLEVTLADEVGGLEVVLSYTVFEKYDVITRSTRIRNVGSEPLTIERALSASIDFAPASWEVLHLSGDWGRERQIVRLPLRQGTHAIESRRGTSSHQQNPFIALISPGTDEYAGEVYALSLVYSGNFIAQAEVNQSGWTRLSMGINPFEFSWLLGPGETFQTPEVVMVHSSTGLDGMSTRFHELYRERLCRGRFRDRERPVLVNNWEATNCNFTADQILLLARKSRQLGIELCVLDDGWFGRRDDDSTSLGDWTVDARKLPAGLGDLARRVNGMGLSFGLWFEPEMISVRSELYAAHPDWCLHVPGRTRSECRHQLVLDLTRQDVRDYIVGAVSAILSSAPIGYVKWDMNRHLTEAGSALLPPERQKETCHRYVLGLYEVLARVTSAFPDVLFECCSGGGGRFDPGILYYMPQTWTSDNTDAICRLRIQYGTSLVYPPVTIGAHVTAVPNQQVNRVTPLDFRIAVAMGGNFGYELDPGRLTNDEKSEVARQTAFYKDIRHLIQFGDFHRLLSPFEGTLAAWMFVARDRSEAWVVFYQIEARTNWPDFLLRLKCLDPDATYRDEASGKVYGGDELMNAGFRLLLKPADCVSCSWHLKQVQ